MILLNSGSFILSYLKCRKIILAFILLIPTIGLAGEKGNTNKVKLRQRIEQLEKRVAALEAKLNLKEKDVKINEVEFKVGDRFNFYNGAGYWGNWVVEITDISGGYVSYKQTNKVLSEIETYKVKVEGFRKNVSEGYFEPLDKG